MRLEQPASTEQPNSTCELLSNNELSCSSNNDLSCSRSNDFSSSRNNDLSCSRNNDFSSSRNNDLSSSRNNDLSSSRGGRRGLHSLLTPTLSSRAKKKEQAGAPSPRSNKVSKGLQPRGSTQHCTRHTALPHSTADATQPTALHSAHSTWHTALHTLINKRVLSSTRGVAAEGVNTNAAPEECSHSTSSTNCCCCPLRMAWRTMAPNLTDAATGVCAGSCCSVQLTVCWLVSLRVASCCSVLTARCPGCGAG